MSKRLIVIGLICITLLILAGCASLNSPKKESQEPHAIDSKPGGETISFTVFFGDEQATYLKGEERTVPKNGKPVAELMITELIQGPESPGLTATIPKETKLLSLEIANGIAYVDFSREIKTKHPGGSAGETMTIYSVVNTLTQLPEIEAVQFLIEGQKQEEIWGHFYTLEPIKADETLIAPKQ
ncbi:GerMN domain-containing protein [Zhaonella formicivorans]|uniref:GerMN domain-containing protein n=1 Tax=Zhaonella formicivorans TaxID=2528593 RepID=UPI001D12D2A0|nr:GerMN domain-containing protein [Zhaonella formicivorans]